MRSTPGALTSILQDLRVGLRALRVTPRITAAAILSLALGSGATTAIFSILNGLLLRTLAGLRARAPRCGLYRQ